MSEYTDEELMRMEYDAMRENRDDWRYKYEDLKVKYEELQELFVHTDEELDYYRENYVNEAIANEHLDDDYDVLFEEIDLIKTRLLDIELHISNTNGMHG